MVGRVPHGHRPTATLAAAVRSDGPVARTVIDGAMTGDLSAADVRRPCVPVLRAGDVVVMDNLQCHERADAVRAIEAAGCEVRFLPPYSPDLYPIERAFADLEAVLRRQEERTVAGWWHALGESLDRFPRTSASGTCGTPATRYEQDVTGLRFKKPSDRFV